MAVFTCSVIVADFSVYSSKFVYSLMYLGTYMNMMDIFSFVVYFYFLFFFTQ